MALALAAGVSAQAAPPTSLLATADYMALPQRPPSARVSYGPSRSQVVEVFLPRGKGPFPVAVMLHGGCWRSQFQGLRQTSGIAADLARRGVAVWNIDYRGVDEPGGGYPGTFQDVARAVDLIRRDAKKYGLDAGRVIAVGHSAGGHLALWAAARARVPTTSVLKVRGPVSIPTVISLGGVGDLRAQEALAKETCGLERAALLGARPDPFADTSPAELLPADVKAIMIHGSLDPIFPPATGRAYADKVKASGDPAEFVEISGVGHFEPVVATTPAWSLVAARVLAEIRALPAARTRKTPRSPAGSNR